MRSALLRWLLSLRQVFVGDLDQVHLVDNLKDYQSLSNIYDCFPSSEAMSLMRIYLMKDWQSWDR